MDNPNITEGAWKEWMRKMDGENDWKLKMLGDWLWSTMPSTHAKKCHDGLRAAGLMKRKLTDY